MAQQQQVRILWVAFNPLSILRVAFNPLATAGPGDSAAQQRQAQAESPASGGTPELWVALNPGTLSPRLSMGEASPNRCVKLWVAFNPGVK